MLIEIAFVQCVLAAVVYLITAVLLFFIVKLKSVKQLWKDSPPLLMLFLSTFILAVDHFKTATVWILVLADVVSYPMGRVYTRIDQIASFWSKWFYDAATIGIFSHRMALLIYPSRAMLHRKLALFIVFAETVVPFLMVGVFQGLNLMNMVRTASPNGLGQQGCYTLNCVFQNPKDHLLSKWLQLIMSVQIIIVGALCQIMIQKYSRLLQSTFNKNINRFTRYVFCFRILLEMVPYTADILLIFLGNQSVALYIGDYILVGGSIDMLLCTMVYLKIAKKNAVNSINSNTRHAFTSSKY